MARKAKRSAERTGSAAREAEILEAYLKVALEEGVDGVTLQKVASRAGVAYSTVHYYFGDAGHSLVDTALQYVGKASEEFMERRLAPALAATDNNALRAYVDAKFEWNKKFPTYASMLCYFLYQATRDKPARQLSSRLYQVSLQKMQAMILQEIGKGNIPPLKDVEIASAKVQTILSGALMADATVDGPREGSVKKLALETIDDVFRAHTKVPAY